MSGPPNVSLSAESGNRTLEAWGNSLPILHEIRHGLKHFAETGKRTLIDLRAIPFGPGDEARLLELLGEGEVEAKIDALGPTRVLETAVHGVWIIDHRNLDDERLALYIEIGEIPQILRTQPQDIEDAIRELDARIGTNAVEPSA